MRWRAYFEPACLLSEVRIPTSDTKKPRQMLGLCSCCLARPEGFEPPTAWFVARYSIQLSYGRLMKLRIVANMALTVKVDFPARRVKQYCQLSAAPFSRVFDLRQIDAVRLHL